jgi:hypothetical protein
VTWRQFNALTLLILFVGYDPPSADASSLLRVLANVGYVAVFIGWLRYYWAELRASLEDEQKP